MNLQRFPLDALKPEIQTWMVSIDKARTGSEGEIVPSFLKIINQISSKLEAYLGKKIEFNKIKSIFIGIIVIQYINDKYAIEKLMTFTKGQYEIFLPHPSKLISQLSGKFEVYLRKAPQDTWWTKMSNSMHYIINKDFKAARAAVSSLYHYFNQTLEASHLPILEALLFSLLKEDIIPIIIQNLIFYHDQYAKNPFSIYFSILRNLIYEIQTTHDQRKTRLQKLMIFFNNLAKLK